MTHGTGSNGSSEGKQRIYEHGRRVGDDTRALAGDVRNLADEVEAFLSDQLERRPYATLAAAAGAGYVLGGGLPPWVLRFGFAVGGRVVLGAVLRELLAGEEEPSPGPAAETSPPPA